MREIRTLTLIAIIVGWPMRPMPGAPPDVVDETAQSESGASPSTPEDRTLAYLAREVPRWSAENNCFSCHNNGDAARALYTAVRLGYRVNRKVLHETTNWLTHPERWRHNGGEGVFSDKKLAAIQFSAALVDAMSAGIVKQNAPLRRAAEIVAGYQERDGSWKIDAAGSVGSPATYGRFLATAVSRRILVQADAKQYRGHIEHADKWLRTERPQTVLDAAAVLLGLQGGQDPAAVAQRRHCLGVIRKGQAESGGWGPYVLSAPEPFDTAVVLLALAQDSKKTEHAKMNVVRSLRERTVNSRSEWTTMIQRGRRFLIERQLSDGSWPETTRPAGSESYAQRLSTTGWATLALLVTRTESNAAD